jgi:hypothetical protein
MREAGGRLYAGALIAMALRVASGDDEMDCARRSNHLVHGIRSPRTFVVKRFENSRRIFPAIRPPRPMAALVFALVNR